MENEFLEKVVELADHARWLVRQVEFSKSELLDNDIRKLGCLMALIPDVKDIAMETLERKNERI